MGKLKHLYPMTYRAALLLLALLLSCLSLYPFATPVWAEAASPPIHGTQNAGVAKPSRFLGSDTLLDLGQEIPPLAIAAASGDVNFLEKCWGLWPTDETGAQHLLVLAIVNGHPTTMVFLLQHGASPSATGTSGHTPLQLAVMTGNLDAVLTLLEVDGRRQQQANHLIISRLIVLFHEKNRRVRILPEFIDRARAMGYRFVHLSDYLP